MKNHIQEFELVPSVRSQWEYCIKRSIFSFIKSILGFVWHCDVFMIYVSNVLRISSRRLSSMDAWKVFLKEGKSEPRSWKDPYCRREETQKLEHHSTIWLLSTITICKSDPLFPDKCQLSTWFSYSEFAVDV